MPTATAYRAWEPDSIEVEKWKPQEHESCEEVQAELQTELSRAKQMRVCAADWDEEVGTIFSEDTLERATSFLKAQSARSRKMYGVFPPVPIISPGPNGSIDLHWKRKNWEMLVNVSAKSDTATFYGDNFGTQEYKGSFDPTTFDYGVLMWLNRK